LVKQGVKEFMVTTKKKKTLKVHGNDTETLWQTHVQFHQGRLRAVQGGGKNGWTGGEKGGGKACQEENHHMSRGLGGGDDQGVGGGGEKKKGKLALTGGSKEERKEEHDTLSKDGVREKPDKKGLAVSHKPNWKPGERGRTFKAFFWGNK